MRRAADPTAASSDVSESEGAEAEASLLPPALRHMYRLKLRAGRGGVAGREAEVGEEEVRGGGGGGWGSGLITVAIDDLRQLPQLAAVNGCVHMLWHGVSVIM